VNALVILKMHGDRDYLSDLVRLTDQNTFSHTHTLCLICDLFSEMEMQRITLQGYLFNLLLNSVQEIPDLRSICCFVLGIISLFGRIEELAIRIRFNFS
jgi:hypothetical protein